MVRAFRTVASMCSSGGSRVRSGEEMSQKDRCACDSTRPGMRVAPRASSTRAPSGRGPGRPAVTAAIRGVLHQHLAAEGFAAGAVEDARVGDDQRAHHHFPIAARTRARFSSTVSFAVMARSTTSSTAPFQASSARGMASGVVAAMPVSTGFTPMRSKWAA